MLSEHCSTPSSSPLPQTFRAKAVLQLQTFIPNVITQVWRFQGRIIVSLAVSALVIGFVLLARLAWDVPITFLMRDMFVLVDQPVYVGLVSNLGILFWAGATTVWAMVAWMARQGEHPHRLAKLAFWSICFTLLLLLDDALMLHEGVLLELFGIREGVAVLALVCMALVYGVRFGWQILTETCFLFAFLAAGFLAASIVIDRIIPFGEAQTLIEDGLKFAGIVFWFSYTVTVFEQIWRDAQKQNI